ncbi:unnamed protein product, partial [Ectocarpus sp. 8 AP-2014]
SGKAGPGRGRSCGGGSLAADLAAHRVRVAGVLHRLPAGDARRVAEEVLLYLVRLLEDLELDAGTAGLKPGQLWGCKAISAAEENGTVAALAAENAVVVLEPGSDAEEAVLVAAAAAAVVAFLREMQQRSGGSGAGGWEKLG